MGRHVRQREGFLEPRAEARRQRTCCTARWCPIRSTRRIRRARPKIGLAKLAIDETPTPGLRAYPKELASRLAEYMLAARQVYADRQIWPRSRRRRISTRSICSPNGSSCCNVQSPRPWLDDWQQCRARKARRSRARLPESLSPERSTSGKHAQAKFHADTRKKLEANQTAGKSGFDVKKEPFFNAVYNANGPFRAERDEALRSRGRAPNWPP